MTASDAVSPPQGWYLDPVDPQRYRWWDGSRWTDHLSGGGEVLMRLPAPQPLATLGWSAIVLLAISALLAVWGAIAALGSYFDAQSAADAVEAGLYSKAAAAQDVFSLRPGIGFLYLTQTLGGIVFIVWFHRAYRNLQRRGFQLRFSTAWAAGAWFIPIFGLVRPKQIANDIWRGDNDGASPRDGALVWKREPVDRSVHWWWGTWLLGGVLLAVGSSLIGAGHDVLLPDAGNFHEAAAGQIVAAVAAACYVAAALLLIKFVQRTGSRQDAARAARLPGA